MLFVQESVTGTDVFDFSVWIEPSVVNFPISVCERFADVFRVRTYVGELPTFPLVDGAGHMSRGEDAFLKLVRLATRLGNFWANL